MGGNIRKVGNWDKVEGLVGNVGREMLIARDTALQRFGLKAEKIAVGHINSQDLNWVPLNPKYVSEKVRKGFSENILVRTSSYFQAITSWREKDTIYIGVKREARGKDGQVIADVARVHEYGSFSGGIPARPLWQPTFEEVLQWQALGTNNPEQIFLNNVRLKYGI